MTAWLRCKLDKGMFSDEVAVTYPSTYPWQKSVFVPRSCVRNGRGELGEVKVVVVVKDGARYAVLPSPLRDIVRVEGADLDQQ
jgi:hypothetical protein